MSTKDDIRKLFETGFREPRPWIDWYFGSVYADSKSMITYAGDRPASCLMIDPYKLKLASKFIDMAYISCCTTAPQYRSQGHMGRLITDALLESAARGSAVASLIPASERLFDYYSRFGFADVFYTDEQHYTALHTFASDDSFIELPADYAGFHTLECRRRAAVIHSAEDFANIMADNYLDAGHVIYIADKETGEPAAMLFATVDSHTATVSDILSTSDAATETAMSILRHKVGECMISVRTPPTENPYNLRATGMARIINPLTLLGALAIEYPATEQVIRLRDRIIPDNNAVYIIHDGHVERSPSTMRRITLDIPVDLLAKVLFNSERTGRIFSMPSFRPTMALMLD